jgi:hypothetical protein
MDAAGISGVNKIDLVYNRRDLSALQKTILVYLIIRSDDYGESTEGISEICESCGCRKRAAIYAMNALKKKGLITSQRRGGDGSGAFKSRTKLKI